MINSSTVVETGYQRVLHEKETVGKALLPRNTTSFKFVKETKIPLQQKKARNHSNINQNPSTSISSYHHLYGSDTPSLTISKKPSKKSDNSSIHPSTPTFSPGYNPCSPDSCTTPYPSASALSPAQSQTHPIHQVSVSSCSRLFLPSDFSSSILQRHVER